MLSMVKAQMISVRYLLSRLSSQQSLLTESHVGFKENLIILAHPSKSGGDWWYGTLPSSGKKGMFPQTYVQQYTPSMCHPTIER